jgi:hypothetical protein
MNRRLTVWTRINAKLVAAKASMEIAGVVTENLSSLVESFGFCPTIY